MKRHLAISITALLIGLSTGGLTPAIAADRQPVANDNTRMNRYDRELSSTTADQAENNESDIQLMQKIRRAVQKENLSLYGKNVKIIAVDGHVTLKGTVRTAEEKAIIAKEAVRCAGAENVTNAILIQSK